MRIGSEFLTWRRKPRWLLLLCHPHLCSGSPCSAAPAASAYPHQARPPRKAPPFPMAIPTLYSELTCSGFPWPNYLWISPFFYVAVPFTSFRALFSVCNYRLICLLPVSCWHGHHRCHHLQALSPKKAGSRAVQIPLYPSTQYRVLDAHSVPPTSLLMNEWVSGFFSRRSNSTERSRRSWS